jgi:FkbM family methyltransferase
VCEQYTNALRELVERECHWLIQKTKLLEGRKYVIIPAGPTAQRTFNILKDKCGIEAEFFVDNNPELENKTVCGKQIKSFEMAFLNNKRNEYIILISSTLENNSQISLQLDSYGISSYFLANAFIVSHLWERYKNVVSLLEDDLSRASYWGAIYSLATENSDFIIRDPAPCYFGLREFSQTDGEVIVDAGAYVGDTVEEYIRRATSGNIKIYAFEPYHAVLTKLNQRIKRIYQEWFIGDDKIKVISAGVGAETKMHCFSNENPTMLRPDIYGGGEYTLQIHSLDDYFKDKLPYTLLKADIEGGEMDMLKGAAKTIQLYKPKMTLCIYHSPHDFAQIAEYVKSLVPEYKLYIRSHYCDYRDTVLYCAV